MLLPKAGPISMTETRKTSVWDVLKFTPEAESLLDAITDYLQAHVPPDPDTRGRVLLTIANFKQLVKSHRQVGNVQFQSYPFVDQSLQQVEDYLSKLDPKKHNNCGMLFSAKLTSLRRNMLGLKVAELTSRQILESEIRKQLATTREMIQEMSVNLGLLNTSFMQLNESLDKLTGSK